MSRHTAFTFYCCSLVHLLFYQFSLLKKTKITVLLREKSFRLTKYISQCCRFASNHIINFPFITPYDVLDLQCNFIGSSFCLRKKSLRTCFITKNSWSEERETLLLYALDYGCVAFAMLHHWSTKEPSNAFQSNNYKK